MYFLTYEGEGDNFLGLTLEKSQIAELNFAKKVGGLEFFGNLFCRIVLFDVFYRNYHVWMEFVLQI